MAKAKIPTKTCIYDGTALRIYRIGESLLTIERGPEGPPSPSNRSDLQNAGWIAVITSYLPTPVSLPSGDRTRWMRTFVDKRLNAIDWTGELPIMLEARKLYGGGSKYQYDKQDGGWSKFVLIERTGKKSKYAINTMTMTAAAEWWTTKAESNTAAVPIAKV